MSTESDFRLSRIYAKGWNAAGRLTADEAAGLDDKSVAALNPYASEADRVRWSEGFLKALGTTGTLTFRGAREFETNSSRK
jgi:hypothetical protein